jgi:hypothetical protein
MLFIVQKKLTSGFLTGGFLFTRRMIKASRKQAFYLMVTRDEPGTIICGIAFPNVLF